MTKPSTIRPLLAALLALALPLVLPGGAAAADVYEASWNGGHLTATANADFTEATIERVSVRSDECGTDPKEATCSWEASAILHSNPGSRCNPATPEDQVVWESGPQPENGTVDAGPIGFPLEGCRGQSLDFEVVVEKTFKEGLISRSRQGGFWTLFTFGYHPVQEDEQRITNESPPANPGNPPPFQPNFTPEGLSVASDCRSLTIGNVRYVFAFHRIGCRKAGMVARKRHDSGAAPRGYACRRRASGDLCWGKRQPQKYVEWRLPGTKPAHHVLGATLIRAHWAGASGGGRLARRSPAVPTSRARRGRLAVGPPAAARRPPRGARSPRSC